MSKKQTLENRLKRAIASSVENEEINRHEIISRAVYQIVKEDHSGPNTVNTRNGRKRSSKTSFGWSVEDLRNLSFGKNALAKNAQLFKGITPTWQEFTFVINEMAKLGVLKAKRYKCADTTVTPEMKAMLEMHAARYTFNHDFPDTDVESDEPTSSKRSKQE